MKKLLKNKKGFSLIELLIVLAILAIIAAIAINLFGGLIGNAKERADNQTAKTLKKAITAYMAASADKGLWFDTAAKATDAEKVIVALQNPIKIVAGSAAAKAGALPGNYGPYLENPNPDATDGPFASAYDPQWTSDQGGTNEGWKIIVHQGTGNVEVEPAEADTFDTATN